LIYLATYCAFERIDELACVVALLAKAPLENSSPVHLATLTAYFLLGVPAANGRPGLKVDSWPEDEKDGEIDAVAGDLRRRTCTSS